MTVYAGDMGNTFAWNGLSAGSRRHVSSSKNPRLVVHEADEPDALVDLHDAEILAGEDGAEVDLAPVEADASAVGHGDGVVVQRHRPIYTQFHAKRGRTWLRVKSR